MVAVVVERWWLKESGCTRSMRFTVVGHGTEWHLHRMASKIGSTIDLWRHCAMQMGKDGKDGRMPCSTCTTHSHRGFLADVALLVSETEDSGLSKIYMARYKVDRSY